MFFTKNANSYEIAIRTVLNSKEISIVTENFFCWNLASKAYSLLQNLCPDWKVTKKEMHWKVLSGINCNLKKGLCGFSEKKSKSFQFYEQNFLLTLILRSFFFKKKVWSTTSSLYDMLVVDKHNLFLKRVATLMTNWKQRHCSKRKYRIYLFNIEHLLTRNTNALFSVNVL